MLLQSLKWPVQLYTGISVLFLLLTDVSTHKINSTALLTSCMFKYLSVTLAFTQRKRRSGTNEQVTGSSMYTAQKYNYHRHTWSSVQEIL